MISCMISYHIKDLTVPSPEAVAFQIERVASCLGPSTVELTLPLNATESPKLPFAPVAGNQVVRQDCVQLTCSPLHVPLGRYLQLLPQIITNPCGKLCRQPADNRMIFAKQILDPLLLRQLAIICTNDIWLLWKDIQTGWFEKMHIQALLAISGSDRPSDASQNPSMTLDIHVVEVGLLHIHVCERALISKVMLLVRIH